jgi:hypothetical protein
VQYRPLTLFWIAEFSDGSALAQFEPETGKENRGHPDWLPSKTDENCMVEKDGEKVSHRVAYPVPRHLRGKRVVRIGWYPFNSELARKVLGATEKLVIPSEAKPVVIDLKGGEKPVCYRSHSLKLYTKDGGVEYGETVYVLGAKGGKTLHINEGGESVGDFR